MAAILERNILKLCTRERLMVTNIFSRGYQYSPKYVKNDLIQEDIQEDLELWKDTNMPTQLVKAAETDQSTFPTYDKLIVRFQNMIMEGGNKALAREMVHNAFEKIKRIQLEKYHKANREEKSSIELNPYKIFSEAVENGKPVLHTRKIWKSGVVYDVPEACPPYKQLFYSLKWIGEAGREKGRTVRFSEQLAHEIINLYNKEGKVITKKQDLHRKCDVNKAYAQLKWKK